MCTLHVTTTTDPGGSQRSEAVRQVFADAGCCRVCVIRVIVVLIAFLRLRHSTGRLEAVWPRPLRGAERGGGQGGGQGLWLAHLNIILLGYLQDTAINNLSDDGEPGPEEAGLLW